MHGNLYVCKTEKQITHTIQHIKDFECDFDVICMQKNRLQEINMIL